MARPWSSGTPLGGTGIKGCAALIAAGVAAAIAAHSRRPEQAATVGASVALGWGLSHILAPDGPLADLSTAWLRQPSTAAVVASIAAVLAARQ